jgi:hypothetical protein
LPSGESWAAAISGLPKIMSRSISGGGTPALAPLAVAMDASRRIHTKPDESFIRGGSFLFGGLHVSGNTPTFSSRLIGGASECLALADTVARGRAGLHKADINIPSVGKVKKFEQWLKET